MNRNRHFYRDIGEAVLSLDLEYTLTLSLGRVVAKEGIHED
jgi:hypothetical protein